MEENIFIKNKKYIIEIIVLIVILGFGFYLFLIHQHKQNLQENIVSQETLKEVNEGLPKTIEVGLVTNDGNNENLNTESESKEKVIEYNEQKLFEFLSLENQPKFLDNLMNDLVIKNNSTTTVEETCSGKNLLEKEECKKSLFIGCSEALFLKFALVNECTQFVKEDYVNYLKAKKYILQNIGRTYYKPKSISTEVGEIIPSEFTLSKEELKDTIDSSVLNNDFSKNNEADDAKVVNDSQVIQEKEIETLQEDKKVLSSLIGSLTGVIANYTGWVQGWATIFAVNGGRHEAGFKMYKTTAFGYNPYNKNTCLISLPYKTVDKFFGTNLNFCVKSKNVSCVLNDKEKVKGRLIEVIMIKNGKKELLPLGDLGPAEWTGNALDMNGCAARKLGGSGKDQVRFRVAR